MPNHPGPIDRRYHALDALRAIMMLLGLVLHAAVSYGAIDYGQAWPYHDSMTTPICDWLVLFIHVFRMPVFFVMAGFFTAFLLVRRGAASMARNRFLRIGVPFVVAWVVLTPLTIAGFIFANVARTEGVEIGWIVAWNEALQGHVFADTTIHLWFLYDLLIFYVASFVLRAVTRPVPPAIRAACMRQFARVLESRWRVPAFALVTAGTLRLTPGGFLETSASFVPNPVMLLAYFVFFGFGWLLYHERNHLLVFVRGAWSYTVLGIVLVPINGVAVQRTIESLQTGPAVNAAAFAATAVTGSLMVWSFVFGLTGLFIRYLDRPSPTVRYIVDASYWLYLVHLPFMVWLPGLFSQVALPGLVKAGLVLAIAAPVGIVSYDLLVRNTVIGWVLNGRRFRRGRPALDPHGRLIETPGLAVDGGV